MSINKRWLLPDHVADVLPAQARQIELTRRAMLDTANQYGYELVMPPLIEHLDSLLTGTGEALDLQTFKLVDQASGRSLGVRADTTPQVARIDAHLLNRQGVARLCYCGPVLHTHPATPHASREPLQFGAEIYGHTGLEADLEVMQLALEVLSVGKVDAPLISLSDIRLVSHLIEGKVNAAVESAIVETLSCKNADGLKALLDQASGLGDAAKAQLMALTDLSGSASDVIAKAKQVLLASTQVLSDLQWITDQLLASGMTASELHIDLSDVGGYGYYSATKFVMLSPHSADPVARGGRYDKVGAVFGRSRPAVGFSLDVKAIVESSELPSPRASIRAPWGTSASVRLAVSGLRARGETVVSVLPGHEHESDEFACDRELIEVNGQWVVKSI